jgi:hypothetical protein
MLVALMTLCLDVGLVAAWLYLSKNPDWIPLAVAITYLQAASAIASLLGLVLLPLVWKVRKVPPPRAIVGAFAVIAITPWVLLWW